MDVTKYAATLRLFNEASSVDDLSKKLQDAGTDSKEAATLAEAILRERSAAGGMFTGPEQLSTSTADRLAAIGAALKNDEPAPAIEKERLQFLSLLLENPNYFGNIENSPLKPIFPLNGNTTYEEMTCVGLDTPTDRLEAIINVKLNGGYSGDICSTGSFEYVRFYVDLHNNGVFHDVGVASVNVHDIAGKKPLSYATYLDFSPIRRLCFSENAVKVRAILSWNVPPPANSPNFTPVWGNRVDVVVQIRPATFFILGDLVKEIDLAKIKLPDPIGPVIQSLNPDTKIPAAQLTALSIQQKREAYAKLDVPVHRFAYSEVSQLLANPAASGKIFSQTTSPLEQLGLTAKEVAGIFGKLQVVTDGDTTFEQLRCAGLKPEKDTLEAVLTLKKNGGYSGPLCSKGSTEYVAFWLDFNDGAGFLYMGTGAVPVHDLASVPKEGIQYAVNIKPNLAPWRIPCQFGARVARLRAILSWETAPPANNPNYVPVWGNRQEAWVQIRPGFGVGHTPLIETVGDAPLPIIDNTTGLATGNLSIASAVFVNQSPFGGEVTVTGEILNPPSVLAGGALPFKYKIEVSPAGLNNFQPLLNPITVYAREAINGFPVFCDIFLDTICPVTLTPTNDVDGFGDGWYTYLEDQTPAHSRHIVNDILARWETTAAMEGLWDVKLTAKDPNTHTLIPGFETARVRIDNTPPTANLTITSATFNGNPIAAVDCGKFPVGTIISGTFSSHDPGTTSSATDFQHFGAVSFSVLPAGPAHGAAVTSPFPLSFPAVVTTGEDGTWTLDTHGMDPCGYVIHMEACDRTNVNSTGNAYCVPQDIGFCLETPPVIG